MTVTCGTAEPALGPAGLAGPSVAVCAVPAASGIGSDLIVLGGVGILLARRKRR